VHGVESLKKVSEIGLRVGWGRFGSVVREEKTLL
jgi:hypothetical protein